MERYRGFEFDDPERFKSLGSFQKSKAEQYQNKSEQEKNEQAFMQFSKLSGANVRALPVVNDGKKNPDGILLDTGEYIDVNVVTGITMKSSIHNALRDAHHQGASIVLIDVRNGFHNRIVRDSLYKSLHTGKYRTLKDIVFLLPNNEMKIVKAKHYQDLR